MLIKKNTEIFEFKKSKFAGNKTLFLTNFLDKSKISEYEMEIN